MRRRVDPYRAAQARQRKAANKARQLVLQKERGDAMGDPIRSTPTPFIESLRTGQPPVSNDTPQPSPRMNFFLGRDELDQSLAYSRYLTEPLPAADANTADPRAEEQRRDEHNTAHQNAKRAMAAIAALETGSSKDRTRANIQRCIEELGRHNTDAVLPPKPPSQALPLDEQAFQSMTTDPVSIVPSKRVGPDTGSSEVQVAILTAKINALADQLGKKDKHNKRNLRLLVHRRQKLLSYLRRKERAGPRWQNLVDKLGITDAMWKGEISL